MFSPQCFASSPCQWDLVELPDDAWSALPDPDEPLGSKAKEWVTSAADPGSQWLLKYARTGSGEYWVECVVHALACLLGIPSACVRPARRNGKNAILSQSVLRPGERLEHGKELLSQVLGCGYDSQKGDNNPGYTVGNVRRSLNDVGPPDATTLPMSGFDVWAGYLVLDAWVAATDRHHENWAIATNVHGVKRLVESFDHGSALGFSLLDPQVSAIQEPAALRTWVENGVSHFFNRPSMVDVASQALDEADPLARKYWIARLAGVRRCDIEDIVDALPPSIMSYHRRNLVLGILDTNRERILHHE